MRATLLIPCLVVAVALCSPNASGADGCLSVVPRPLESVRADGQVVLSGHTRIVAESRDAAKVARILSDGLSGMLGSQIEVRTDGTGDSGKDRIVLRLDPATADLGPEGYKLSIADTEVVVSAPKGMGLFYGVQTILQLCRQDTTAQKMVTARRIVLQPERSGVMAELRDGGPSGSGRYLHIPADAVLRGSDKDRVLDLRMTPFLVEAWVRNPGQPERQYGSTIVSFGQAGPGGWRFGIDGKGRVIFTLYGIYDATGPNSIIPVDGRWHHLAVNLRKDRRLLYFIDGKLTDTLDTTSFAAGAMDPIVVLGNDIGHVTHFEGDVDRIRISAGEFEALELDWRP